MLKIEKVDYSWEDDYGSLHQDIQHQLWDTEASVNPLYASRNSSNACVTHAIGLADKVYEESKDYSIFRYKGAYYKAVYKPSPKLSLLSKEDVEAMLHSATSVFEKTLVNLARAYDREQKTLNKVLKKMNQK